MYKERIKIVNIVKKIEDKDMPFTMDGSLAPIKNPDGSITYFCTDFCKFPYYHIYKGTASSPFDEYVGEFNWYYNGYAKGYPNGLWAQSIYRCEDGTLIGFMHREEFHDHERFGRPNYHIGLGISEDGGMNWFYAGDICGNCCNNHITRHANMGGCPAIVKDGYFYTYFNEYDNNFSKYISAARFSVAETIDALKKKKLPNVYKYSGDGKWEIDGFMENTGAPIITKSPYSDDYTKLEIDAHSKAAYCKPLDCFIMTMQTGNNGDLVMYFSPDAVHWDEFMMDSAPKNPDGKSDFMLPYSCFVDISGNGSADSFTVGEKFCLHSVHKKIKDYDYDEYYVKEITVI